MSRLRPSIAPLISLALAVCLLLAMPAWATPAEGPASPCPPPAEGEWYRDAAFFCLEAGLFAPDGEGNFPSPQGTLTWAEAVWLAAGLRALLAGAPAPILPPGQWDEAVNWLEGNGLLCPNPEGIAHRQGFAYLLYHAAPPDYWTAVEPRQFSTTYPYYTPDYVAGLYRAGVLSGVEFPGDFQPDQPVTRAQAAMMLHLALRPGEQHRQEEWPVWMDGILTYEILLRLDFSFPGATDPLDPPYLEGQNGQIVGCHTYFTCLAEQVLPQENPYTFQPEGPVDWAQLAQAARREAQVRQLGGEDASLRETAFSRHLTAEGWYTAFRALRGYGA